jgi:hypothetical protein
MDLLKAMRSAIEEHTKAASSIFVEPSNRRSYSCSFCSRSAYAKGLCNAHYIRQKKGLPMDVDVRARKRHDCCEKCGQKTGAKGGWGMCQKHYRQERYEAIKDAAISVLGPNCSRCGGSFHRSVFDFHHVGEKSSSPSSILTNKSLEYLAEELSRCVLLCANCHRLEHHDELR